MMGKEDITKKLKDIYFYREGPDNELDRRSDGGLLILSKDSILERSPTYLY